MIENVTGEAPGMLAMATITEVGGEQTDKSREIDWVAMSTLTKVEGEQTVK